MALSNAERQARYRHKVKTGELSRIDAKIPAEIAIKLNYLAWHWHCTKAEALGRLLLEAWEREGRPVPGGEGEDKALPSHTQVEHQDQEPPQKVEEGGGGVLPSFPTGHPEKAPPRPPEAQKHGPGAQTLARWQKEAEKRVLNGLTAIMEHFNERSRYEGMTYAGIRDLLSEMDYEIACRTEIRRMQREGLNWTAMARTLNEKDAPLPAGQGRGKWTGLKIKALMA